MKSIRLYGSGFKEGLTHLTHVRLYNLECKIQYIREDKIKCRTPNFTK